MFGIFGFLGFILIFILVIVLFFFALLGNFIRSIFGLNKRGTQSYQNASSATKESKNNTSTLHSDSASTGKKKIFAEDEGEYVEYEEIK